MNKENVAVLGSGGREHAIISSLQKSPLTDIVYALPGNGGTANNIPLAVNDFPAIKKFCSEKDVSLIFVGPENPLSTGIVDYFQDSSIKVFGPDKRAAQLESSKIFAKKFMQKYGVATAAFQHFCKTSEARDFCRGLNGSCVIKYDGLAAGKGVFVCSDMPDVEEALCTIEEKYSEHAKILVEERLSGQELSILAFTDGENFQLLLPSQDHKQLLEGDKGPNTGGMGAFCPVDFCDDKMLNIIKKKIIIPTFKGIKAEGFNYKGVLYFGLMIDQNIPRVLEFNVRLGDPETEVVLPALKTDLMQLVLACFDDSLPQIKMEFHDGYFADVVLVSQGYPGKYEKNMPITGLDKVNCSVFHAGTKMEKGELLTNGGRVLNIVAQGETLSEALTKCYSDIPQINFMGKSFRKDIGRRK